LQKKELKHKSESISFRVPCDLLSELHEEAERKEISLNTLVTQIMRRHVDWYSFAAYAGFVYVTKGFIMKTLQKISEEDIISIAKYTSEKETKDFVLLLRNQYNARSALDVIETWIRISGYPYRHKIDNTTHSYVIQHDMGRKWSLRLVEIYQFILSEFKMNDEQVFDVGENTLSFSVNFPKVYE